MILFLNFYKRLFRGMRISEHNLITKEQASESPEKEPGLCCNLNEYCCE